MSGQLLGMHAGSKLTKSIFQFLAGRNQPILIWSSDSAYNIMPQREGQALLTAQFLDSQ